MIEKIAKIERTSLGYEDHGILTAYLHLNGGGWGQGAGGFGLDDRPDEDEKGNRFGPRKPHASCGAFIMGVLAAVGVDTWEKVAGKTIYALYEDGNEHGGIIGIRNLPTEKGGTFIFKEAFPND